jgi:Peptidase family C54.
MLLSKKQTRVQCIIFLTHFLCTGRDWCWDPESQHTAYLQILHMFEDRRAATYSIHQIALMGASEGKEVGQWFGPNTVAQVLK